MDRGHLERFGLIGRRTVANQDGAIVGRVGAEAMAAAHDARVERNHVEERPEPKRLLDQPPHGPAFRPEAMRVEEEFTRIVAGLTMDIDRPGEIGGKTIVEPVFGQMATLQNAKQLLLRGLDGAKGEWLLLAACHNLRKLHRHLGNDGLAALATS